jgi:hypoxanthine-DNA glycosylase
VRRRIASGSAYEDLIGYSRAVCDPDGWVFVSGCTGTDPVTMTLPDGVEDQCAAALATIGAALAAAGATFADVVRVRYILPVASDFERCWPQLRRVRRSAPGSDDDRRRADRPADEDRDRGDRADGGVTRHSSFAPVADARTRVLILGSLPGAASLAAARYYAHPQNQFWRLLGGAIGSDLAALAYVDRLAALREAGIGLWDVVATARRSGSLDAAIRDVAGNDLAALIATLPALRLVAFNGQKAAAIGTPLLPPGTPHLTLPSSSPAHTLAFAAKAAAWAAVGAIVGEAAR